MHLRAEQKKDELSQKISSDDKKVHWKSNQATADVNAKVITISLKLVAPS